MTLKPVLYVEDEEDDVFFMQMAFKSAGLPNPLSIVSDGREAIDYLSGAGKYMDRDRHPLPCLVLLDLKLPKKSGFDVLRWIRSHGLLSTMLVIVLTSSNHDRDIHTAYSLGGNAFLVKPATPEELAAMVKSIGSFWLTLNRPPPESARLIEKPASFS
jgi:CheY-like chemotaxis protein